MRRSTAGPSTPMSFAVQITGTAMRSSRRWMNTRELATGSSNTMLRPTNRSSASSNSSSVLARCREALGQPQAGEPLVATGFVAVLVGFGDRAQPRADPRGQGRGERGLAGAGRPVEQDVDAALLPVERRAQDGGGDLRLAAEMREGIPGQRLRRRSCRAVGRRSPPPAACPAGSATSAAPAPSSSAVALKLQQAARQQPRIRPSAASRPRPIGALQQQRDQRRVPVEPVGPPRHSLSASNSRSTR